MSSSSRKEFLQLLCTKERAQCRVIGAGGERGEAGHLRSEEGPTMLHVVLYLSVVQLFVDCSN